MLLIALRSEYTMNSYLTMGGHLRQTFLLWNIAVLTAIVLAFLTKTSAEVSRSTSILFYCCGFTLIIFLRLVMVRIVRVQARAGNVALIESCVNFDPVFENITFRGAPDIRIIAYKDVPAMAMLRLPTFESDGRSNLY